MRTLRTAAAASRFANPTSQIPNSLHQYAVAYRLNIILNFIYFNRILFVRSLHESIMHW